MMWGRYKENGIWIDTKSVFKIMFFGHDSLYIAVWRFRFRIMKWSANRKYRQGSKDCAIRKDNKKRKPKDTT